MLSVPDECYYSNVPDGGYYVPDEGYYVPDEGYFERTWWRLLSTWWRLFQKRIVCTKFDIYVFIQKVCCVIIL